MVNPVEILPFETVIRIFSQGLLTADIQRAAATARNWRIISTDEIINQVIDITDFHLGEDETIETIQLLASRSSRQGSEIGKEIRLNVDSFWYEIGKEVQIPLHSFWHETTSGAYMGTIETYEALQVGRLMEGTGLKKFIKLLSALQLSTHGQLGKLFLDFFKGWEGYIDRFRSRILGNLLVYSADFLNSRGKNFIEIRFNVRFPLSFTMGDDSKRFSIESGYVDELEYDIDSCITILKGAASFTGGRGLTTLEINLRNFIDVDGYSDEELDRLYQELGKSQHTLSELDVTFNRSASPFKFFPLLSTFSSLSSLTMNLDGGDDDDELLIPNFYPEFHLKSLKLTLSTQVPTQFEWLVNMAKKSLIEFELSIGLEPEDLPSTVPPTLIFSILETCLSLNRISLRMIGIEQVILSSSTQVLPSLVSLDLPEVGLSIYEFFSKCSMPTLQHFSLKHNFLNRHYGASELEMSRSSEVIYKILNNSSSSLVTLRLNGTLDPFQSEDQEEQSIIFQQLRVLRVMQSNPTALSLLSRCKSPRLKTLEISSTSAQAQSIFQLLHSNSASLQQVHLHNLTFVPTESQQTYSRERLLFPRLGHLELRANQSEIELMDIFSNVDSRKLQVVNIVLTSDPNRIKTVTGFPTALLSLMKTNASSLKSLNLNGRCGSFNREDAEGDQVLKFQNLTVLRYYIPDYPSLPQCLFFKSQYPKLTHLDLNCNSLPDHEVLGFLRNCSSTLVDLELRTWDEENRITSSTESKVKVEFPNLRSIHWPSDKSDLLDDLFSLNRGTLKELEVEEMEVEEILQKLKEIAPRLRKIVRR